MRSHWKVWSATDCWLWLSVAGELHLLLERHAGQQLGGLLRGRRRSDCEEACEHGGAGGETEHDPPARGTEPSDSELSSRRERRGRACRAGPAPCRAP